MTDSIQYAFNGPFRLEEVRSLFQSAEFNVLPLSKLLGMISRSSAYVTAKDGDTLIGFGRVLTDYHSIAYINYMAVDPVYQRKGIGQSILQKLVEASGDVERVFLYTNTADAFYVHRGFTPFEKRLYLFRKQGAQHYARS
jgi:N-acetylglutamate synthase-like GNAT family acetyltransferase